MLDYHSVVQEIVALAPIQWDYQPDVADARADAAYIYECQRHPFPRFTVSRALPGGGRQRGGRGWGGGRGGCQMEVGEGSGAGRRRTWAQATRGGDEEEVKEEEMAVEESEEEAPLRW